MSDANKALARRYFEQILNDRNLGVCDTLLAKDFVEHAAAPFTTSGPGRVDGPATMRQTAEVLFEQLPDIHMTVEDVMAEGDMVAVRVLAEATTGVTDGSSEQGRRFAAGQMHWFRVGAGKLAEHWAVRDDLAAVLQVSGIHPQADTPVAPRRTRTARTERTRTPCTRTTAARATATRPTKAAATKATKATKAAKTTKRRSGGRG